MPSTLSLALDDLFATTWQNRLPGIADNIFGMAAFWYWMKEKGKIDRITGGTRIEVDLAYATNSGAQFITRGGSTTMQDYKFLTTAYYDWRYMAVPVLRYGVDDQKNAGSNRIHNWVNEKLNNSEESMVDLLETTLAAGQSTSDGFDGLQFLVPDFANVGSASYNAGHIDPSVDTWWRNQALDMTGLSFATYGISKMRTLFHNCMKNRKMDAPDIILSDQTTYEGYEDRVLGFYRTENRDLADAGFNNQTFKGVPMVWATSISQRMYMLNTRYLSFKVDPNRYFDMTSWKEIPQQVEDRIAHISLACAFVTNRRRVQGVMSTINTP